MSEASVIAAHLTGARPRVVAALTHYFRDIDLAQDGFQEASAKALKHWPSNGIPTNAVAWLTVAARNSVLDELRRSRRQGDLLQKYAPFDTSIENPEDDILKLLDENVLRDDILRLLFMCSHPELAPTDQIALALKVIGGLSVAQIARAFLLHAKTMEQRITRAKKKAAAAATELDVPTAIERSKRLNSVCTMVYLMFNEGYSMHSGSMPISVQLCEEAIRLARLLLSLFPSQPEIMGLLALFLFQHSRQEARTNEAGDLVPLDQQDRAVWNMRHINEAHVLLEKALRIGAAGSYQIQAAIAGVHCMAKSADETDWN
ncbi:MAG: sigma-70 family RNA polymerase sigma factor, partial [Rhizobiales bacterium]|nr:sigma-70 family RNA polymerase sigma factor [Hyphomicrobiales bacterium]